MLSRINSAGMHGINAYTLSVEVDISNGLPGWHMAGLPEAVVRESKDRVTSAIRNSGFQLKQRKITINLAPADRRKGGTLLDLPIAVGLMEASELLPSNTSLPYLLAGELSLDGSLLPIEGAISISLMARSNGFRGVILPSDNHQEASMVDGLVVIAARRFSDVVRFLRDGIAPAPPEKAPRKALADRTPVDLADVRGQAAARRALEIAAAGGHHLLMIGPPGTGKTMLAERFGSILPPLNRDESLETTRIYSVMGLIDRGSPLIIERPFRAPHHSISFAGMLGGGINASNAGEISLAHNGVLFLDELPEFRRDVIEALRQPLERSKIRISRVGCSVSYPSRFQLIAASNPCPCGYLGHPSRTCRCSPGQVQQYRRKLSGPLIDRLDIHINLTPLRSEDLTSTHEAESSRDVKERVLTARALQAGRLKPFGLAANAQMPPKVLRTICSPSAGLKKMLCGVIERLGLSGRAYDKILRIARTIADLSGGGEIAAPHVAEAIQYRVLDREDV